MSKSDFPGGPDVKPCTASSSSRDEPGARSQPEAAAVARGDRLMEQSPGGARAVPLTGSYELPKAHLDSEGMSTLW